MGENGSWALETTKEKLCSLQEWPVNLKRDTRKLTKDHKSDTNGTFFPREGHTAR